MANGRIPPFDKQQIAQRMADQKFSEMAQQQRMIYMRRVANGLITMVGHLLENDYERAQVFHDLAALIAVRAGGSKEAMTAWIGKCYDAKLADFKREAPERYAKVFGDAAAVARGENVEGQQSVLVGMDGQPITVDDALAAGRRWAEETKAGGESDGRTVEGDSQAGEDSRPAAEDATASAEGGPGPTLGCNFGPAESTRGADEVA